MILPNKLIRFEDSIISRIPCLLKKVEASDQNLMGLYEDTKKSFADINQYILTLDVLFVLGKIKLDKESRNITYVASDRM